MFWDRRQISHAKRSFGKAGVGQAKVRKIADGHGKATRRKPAERAKEFGTRSLDGKRRSSPNALRHGLTSTQMVIPGEDPAEFSEFRLSVNGGVIPGHYGGIEVGQ